MTSNGSCLGDMVIISLLFTACVGKHNNFADQIGVSTCSRRKIFVQNNIFVFFFIKCCISYQLAFASNRESNRYNNNYHCTSKKEKKRKKNELLCVFCLIQVFSALYHTKYCIVCVMFARRALLFIYNKAIIQQNKSCSE